MNRLVPPSRTRLTLAIAVIAAGTFAAAVPGSSTQAGQPPAAHAGAAGDPDVLGAERLFSAWMEGQIAYRGLPGSVVGVVNDQELVWSKGFGFADINAKLPMTTRSRSNRSAEGASDSSRRRAAAPLAKWCVSSSRPAARCGCTSATAGSIACSSCQ